MIILSEPSEMLDTLASMLPAGITYDTADGRWNAQTIALFQAERLQDAGYALAYTPQEER